MGKSVFLTSEVIYQYVFTADNILIAKIMHDAGMPLDSSLHFYVDSPFNDNFFFFKAMEVIFLGCHIEIVENEEETFKVRIENHRDVIYWHSLQTEFKGNDKFNKDNNSIVNTLDAACEFFELSMNGKFIDIGIELSFEGFSTSGMYHKMVEALLSFEEMIKERTIYWRGILNGTAN
ncbi:hypothetical protein V1503_24140 [Bacillus sp. SCS-151]|uniref:hypothetical protein n=1 Tax=Nanhaiella sioensis TaxID=3115293 RepID=UPI00397D7AAC